MASNWVDAFWLYFNSTFRKTKYKKQKKLTKKHQKTNALLLILKGIIMGAANKVPGVSGGIVAFVMGFYETFINSLQKFNLKAVSLFFRGQFNSFFQHINGRFLSLLFLGVVISYFSVSKLLSASR